MIPSFIEAALRSVLVALAVWAGLRMLRVGNVLAQKAAWGLVLAAAVLMPMLLPIATRWQALPAKATVVLPAHPIRALANLFTGSKEHSIAVSAPLTETQSATHLQKTDMAASSEPTSVPSQSLAEGTGHYPAPTVSSSYTPTAVPSQSAVTRRSVSTGELAWLLYLSVAAVLLIRIVYGLAAAILLWYQAEPANIDSQASADGLSLRSSRSVSSPVTIGSAIVLPDDYASWDREKLRVVLAHERSHIRQGDFYLQTLAGIYAALFWFSPLGWWLKRKLSDLAEAISDRAGLQEAASRSAYAQILLEFAAAPRPTLIGVAMARTGNLSRRIERLLNDSTFRQAFAGTRRRAFLAVLLVPVALFAATTLVRVEASGQSITPPPEPAQPAAPLAGVSTPEAPADVEPAVAPALGAPEHLPAIASAPPAPAAPVLAGSVGAPPTPPATLVLAGPRGTLIVPPAAPVMAPGSLVMPPAPPAVMVLSAGMGAGQSTTTVERGSRTTTGHNGYRYSFSSNGDSYAIIKGDGDNVQFSGNWMNGRQEDLAKARKMAHGDFLWFNRAGKSYYIDDQAIVGQVEDMYKPMEALGKQQEELGRQQEELGKKQEELGHQQEQVSIPTPDLSKEIAEIEKSMATLKAKQGKNMTTEEYAELQSKLGDLQGKMGEIQGQIGAKQGEFGAKMGKLGAMQGELGAKQGKLGAEQGRIAQEADRKVKGIIDQSLTNGKAHPVQ